MYNDGTVSYVHWYVSAQACRLGQIPLIVQTHTETISRLILSPVSLYHIALILTFSMFNLMFHLLTLVLCLICGMCLFSKQLLPLWHFTRHLEKIWSSSTPPPSNVPPNSTSCLTSSMSWQGNGKQKRKASEREWANGVMCLTQRLLYNQHSRMQHPEF